MEEEIEEPKTLKQQIYDLNQSIKEIEKKKKPKEFKVPWKARIGKRKLKDNWVTIMKINENRNVDFIKKQINEQTVIIDGVPRIASGEYVLTHKSKPIIIQPSWSVEPFSPAENYERGIKEQMNKNGFRLILNTMKSELINAKKKLNLGIGIGALLVIGIVIYIIINGF